MVNIASITRVQELNRRVSSLSMGVGSPQTFTIPHPIPGDAPNGRRFRRILHMNATGSAECRALTCPGPVALDQYSGPEFCTRYAVDKKKPKPSVNTRIQHAAATASRTVTKHGFTCLDMTTPRNTSVTGWAVFLISVGVRNNSPCPPFFPVQLPRNREQGNPLVYKKSNRSADTDKGRSFTFLRFERITCEDSEGRKVVSCNPEDLVHKRV